tara:strand:- start:2773 stop:4497 length:1725 start_codon:yes stop_codon:yes gene_type:complete
MAESERQKLDLNIDNWTVEDLYDLFDIPKNASTNEVANMADKVIERQTEGEVKYFLQLARNKIIKAQQAKLEGDQYTERTDEQLKVWWENQYLTTGDARQSEKATIRTNKVEIFDDENGHYQMKQNRLGVNNTHNVPFLQGTMNPTLVNEIERTVIIDSQYRTNIYPYSGGTFWNITDIVEDNNADIVGNPSSPSFNTDFTLSLSETLTNVLEIKLDTVSIPKTWFDYSPFVGNSRFVITDPSGDSYLVELQEFNPSQPGEIPTYINNAIQTDATIPQVVRDDIWFQYASITANRMQIISKGTDQQDNPYVPARTTTAPLYGRNYKITWFNPDLFERLAREKTAATAEAGGGFSYGVNCFNVEYTNNNLGWYLGWRNTPDKDNNVSVEYQALISQLGSEYPGMFMTADTTPKSKTIDYLVVVLDEFNKNRLNTGIVSGVQQSTKLAIPEYTNADNLNCNEEGNQPFFSKVAPRQLTQAQLYTINSIVEDRQKSKNRNTAPTLSDAFCIIPVPDVKQNDRIVLYSDQLSTSIRKYFGPVNIERFRAALYDDKGNIVNLKGHDWNITLKAKQLYQY